jgi:hypothetical protein
MAINKVFTHGVIKGDTGNPALYSFVTQPIYTGKLHDDESAPSTDEGIGGNQTKNIYNSETGTWSQVSYIYPEMSGIAYDTQFVCSLHNDTLIHPEKFEFSIEPPKALMFPDPKIFTLMGPYFFGLSQPAVYNEFIQSTEDYSYGIIPISIIYDHMQVYYIPTDPIQSEEDINKTTNEKSLTLYYRGLLTELETKEKPTEIEQTQETEEVKNKYKVMCETANVGATFTRSTNSKRVFTFITKAQIGTYRLSIMDAFTRQTNPAKNELTSRIDKSIVIKLWPRTLPVHYQMDTDGILQRVGFWDFTFSPMPKPNYNIRFFNMDNDEPIQLDLNWPIEPQTALLNIQKIDTSVTGDNEPPEVSVSVHFWRLNYNSKPYIPTTIELTIDGTTSKPLRWYILPISTTRGEKPAVLTVDKNDPEKWFIVGVSKGKFKLVVTDGSFLSYVSSEIEVN